MFNKKMKKFAAVILSASMIFGAGVAAVQYTGATVMAEETQSEETEKAGVSLAIAGEDDEAQEQETEEEQTEAPETEAPVVYDQLETTNTEEVAISAVDVSDIVEKTMPSIVSITGKSVQQVESYFYGQQEIEMEGAGSGFIIAQDEDELLIATNNHVVADTNELTVCFTVDAENTDDLLAPAKVKGTSSKYDLAVIAVQLADIKEDVFKQLKIATLGSSDNLKVGEASIVIGNALGVGQTVTTGIISALEREITTEVGTFTELQTDAAINFGCSGGAILNAKGEVIGITSAKATDEYAESMGYGIPIDTAIPVLKELVNRETRDSVEKHGYLGITVVPVSDEANQMYGVPMGAYVYEVTEGSAADQAGLKKGDIITKFDGIEVTSSDELVSTLGYYSVGETVTVELQSVGEGGAYTSREVEVTLQEGPEQEETEPARQPQEDPGQMPDEESYGEDGYNGYAPFEGFDDFGQFIFGDGFGGGRGNGWY